MVSARYATKTARRLLTTRMALALGFGVLLTLLVLSGLNAIRAISQLQASNENILSEFLGPESRLDELRSAIYLSGTYVRDYLLEPDPGRAEQSRAALADTRQEIQSMASSIGSAPDATGQGMYDNLRREVQEYHSTPSLPGMRASATCKVTDFFMMRCCHGVRAPSASRTLSRP